MDKIEHEEIGTCERIEVSRDADNAHQKVKWCLIVHKTKNLLWEAYFYLSFIQVLIHVHISEIFYAPPPPPPKENESCTEQLEKIIQFSITLSLILQLYQVSAFYLLYLESYSNSETSPFWWFGKKVSRCVVAKWFLCSNSYNGTVTWEQLVAMFVTIKEAEK